MNINFKSTKIRLPKIFKHLFCKDLDRLGNENDGGYLVSRNDISKSDILFSFGIDVDWSFEEDFLKKNKLPVYGFDASSNFLLFLRRSIGAFLRNDYKLAITLPFKYFSFKKFFSINGKFFPKYISLKNDKKNVSLSNVFSNYSFSNAFIKIDIEGSEYELLEEILKNQKKLSGLVIEFHYIDLGNNLEKVNNFINEINMKLVHIHINNWSIIRNNLPTFLELTFSKYGDISTNNPVYPHKLDRPNNLKRKDYIVSFD